MDDLRSARNKSNYGRQKSHLEKELQTFLHGLCPRKTLLTCTPKNVTQFLVWKDHHGRTKIHKPDCKFLGAKASAGCTCPTRLAANTVDSTIGKLRAIFNSLDRAGDYDIRTGAGNPASHFSVKHYLHSVRLEQAEARISPTQATPLFFQKFLQLVRHLRSQLSKPSSSAIEKYIYARDLAFFCLEFFTGQRASDLGRLRTIDVLEHPDGKTLLIHQRIGKTIRGSQSRPVPIYPCQNPAICPVENLRFYRTLCSSMGIPMDTGLLFRATTKRTAVSNSPFLASAAQARLIAYLTTLGLYEKESVHGFRSGTAILLGLLGASKSDIATHIGWRSPTMVNHYTQLTQVLSTDGTAKQLSDSTLSLSGNIPAADLTQQFHRSDHLIGFKSFFQQSTPSD